MRPPLEFRIARACYHVGGGLAASLWDMLIIHTWPSWSPRRVRYVALPARAITGSEISNASRARRKLEARGLCAVHRREHDSGWPARNPNAPSLQVNVYELLVDPSGWDWSKQHQQRRLWLRLMRKKPQGISRFAERAALRLLLAMEAPTPEYPTGQCHDPRWLDWCWALQDVADRFGAEAMEQIVDAMLGDEEWAPLLQSRVAAQRVQEEAGTFYQRLGLAPRLGDS